MKMQFGGKTSTNSCLNSTPECFVCVNLKRGNQTLALLGGMILSVHEKETTSVKTTQSPRLLTDTHSTWLFLCNLYAAQSIEL